MHCFGIMVVGFRDGTALESCPIQRADGTVWSLRADTDENYVTGKKNLPICECLAVRE